MYCNALHVQESLFHIPPHCCYGYHRYIHALRQQLISDLSECPSVWISGLQEAEDISVTLLFDLF